MSWMNYILIYIAIGAFISVLTWLYYTSKWCKRQIPEDALIVYLPLCTVAWPVCVISACYEFYNYLKVKWDF